MFLRIIFYINEILKVQLNNKEEMNMSKIAKTKNDNQWTSVPEQPCKKSCCNKKHKTATDNQWTSTLKNNVDDNK